jgi:hypothetical protein
MRNNKNWISGNHVAQKARAQAYLDQALEPLLFSEGLKYLIKLLVRMPPWNQIGPGAFFDGIP